MKTDMYTKAILTIIAACLVWICVNGATPPVRAQGNAPSPTPVVLVDARGVPLITPDGLRVNVGGLTVPVSVRNETVPMVLTAVERHGTWQAISVDVVKPPPTPMPTP
jgi:hypothetical protein